MPVDLKIPQIARFRLAGIKDVEIQRLIKMSPGGFYRLVNTDEYKDYEDALKQRHLGKMDAALEGNVNAIRQELTAAVPSALRCLVDTVTQGKDLKMRFEAAKEILDRDPNCTLTKDKNRVPVTPNGLSAEALEAAVVASNEVKTAVNPEKAVN